MKKNKLKIMTIIMQNFNKNPFELRICCPGRRMIGKDDWEGKWYPGMVKEVGDLITVKSMEVPTFGKNCFKWPKSVDVLPYEPCDIICKISPPKPISSRFFGLSEDDFKDVNGQYRNRNADK